MTGTPLRELYGRMVLIRRLEETLLELFSLGKLVGTTHTYIGQEANAVGVIDHLDPARDVAFSNHRCHGHYLAFTDDVDGLLGEVMGRVTGVCGGKGGSQHLCNGNFYSNGVQGSIVPVATGMALAERETGAVTVVFLGDGTLGQGTVYECLNLASLWSLPILFLLENNHYAQTTPRELAVAGSIPDRALPFGIDSFHLDTTDVLAVHGEAGRVIDRVRSTGRPAYLSIDTYRFSPHSKGDDTRDPAEIDARRERDPLTVAGSALSPTDRDAIEAAVRDRLAAALETAERAPAAGRAAALAG